MALLHKLDVIWLVLEELAFISKLFERIRFVKEPKKGEE
jgi:hypothetical protein